MPYIINFTDVNNKTPITVFDNTSNTDTSLVFPGRNVAGYGQIIAENFIKILENFANNEAPINAIEGQLWFDNEESILKIYDGILWKAASNIQRGPVEPSVEDSNVGELWVDTTNQQLRIYTGTRWILVGPVESTIDGLRYGPAIETIIDSDNILRPILIFYLADIPLIIVSKDSFTPKVIIEGYVSIKTGINVTSLSVDGLFSKFHGTATTSESLVVGGIEIPAGRFLRSDISNTVDQGFNIRGSAGLTLGTDGTFNIAAAATSARIYNSTSGSSIDLQVNRDGIPNTILRVIENRVGINNESPDEALDVDGNIRASGTLVIQNTNESTNLNNGSFRIAGGAAISKNLIVGTNLDVSGLTQVRNLQPRDTDSFDSGTALRRWRTVRAKKVIAEELEGVLVGNISGNANTATNLKNVTTFQIAGDIISPRIQFDGQIGSYTKVFNTTLTSNIISSKSEPFPNISQREDQILIFRPSLATSAGGSTDFRINEITSDFTLVTDVQHQLSIGDFFTASITSNGLTLGATYYVIEVSAFNRFKISAVPGGAVLPLSPDTSLNIPGRKGSATSGLIKQSRDVFVADLGVPIGAIMPFAGNNLPRGYLLCDGSEVEIVKFPDLFDIIGNTYGIPEIGFGTFKLPDLRGRFPLGRDNMDNNFTVPTVQGGVVDAGGGNIDRVADTNADVVGGAAGQSQVTLTLGNLPDHTHSLNVNDVQYNAVRVDTSIRVPAVAGLGPTAPGQAQYLPDSGPIKKPSSDFNFSVPVGIMNPYLTINYIIRSGPPRF
jgi:microcystin-dependent protein